MKAIKLTKIITVEDFLEYQSGLRDVFDDNQIEDAINLATNDINAFTNLLLEKVYIFNASEPKPTDKSNPLYRNETEMTALYQAVISQTYFKLMNGNDSSVGDASYAGAGVSLSQSFSERNLIGTDVFQWLINARLINFNKEEQKEFKKVQDGFFDDSITDLMRKPYPDPVYVPSKFSNYVSYSLLMIDKLGYVIQSKLTDVNVGEENKGLVVGVDENGFLTFVKDQKQDVFFQEIKGEPKDNVKLARELNTIQSYINELYAALNAVEIEITNKAYTAYVNAELAMKANIIELNNYIPKNGIDTEVQTPINFKNAPTINAKRIVTEDSVVIDSFALLNSSANVGQGNLIYKTEPDGGNPWIETNSYSSIRTGQIVVSNKYNGTSLTQMGNRWYVNGGLIANIPEINDNRKVVKFTLDVNAPSWVVANNTEASGYSIRFDSATYSNIDTQIVFGIGANNQKREGYITCPLRGYYIRNNNTYQYVQYSLYFEFGESEGREYFELWGSGMGRDRYALFNKPTDVAGPEFAPQNYVINYKVYNKEQI